MSDRIIIEELIGATLVRFDDADGNLLWDVHFLCTDGVKREYVFVTDAIAREFVLTYCDSTEVS